MSQLIDTLTRSSPSTRQPFGFGQRKVPAAKPKLALIASLPPAKVTKLAGYVEGADAALWHISPDTDTNALRKASKSVPDFIWGWWTSSAGRDELKKLLEPGDDFVVFPADAPVVKAPDEKTALILQIDPSTSEVSLRAINALPLDAVLAPSEEGSPAVTWRQLMFLQRLAALLAKPVLAIIPPDVTAAELQSLCDTGINGVVVPVDTGASAGKMKELRQMVDGLTYTRARQRGQAEALLPGIKPGASQVSADEEDEEDEDY